MMNDGRQDAVLPWDHDVTGARVEEGLSRIQFRPVLGVIVRFVEICPAIHHLHTGCQIGGGSLEQL